MGEGDRFGREASVAINAAQLLLAEKRTSLASLRTGIAVIALPVTVLSFLIATSRYYDVCCVVPILALLSACCLALVVLGAHLIFRALRNIRRCDRQIKALKARYGEFFHVVDPSTIQEDPGAGRGR